ncbi:MAG: Gfo/Idh/MocA family oxidoreductase [Planctomycetes bacterium]|nr:Gfo/Idh/MocA family oxidoreductase [Planctomycetota bacterium]MBL7037632.1 Gfo/Idh/MocA family oxidoreductase [Pirellulaceae bacterium]
MNNVHSRRRFLAGAATFGFGAMILPRVGATTYQANERANIALVGCGGRGRWFAQLIPRINENFVALCDVDEREAANTYKQLPDVPKYRDFREMLSERDKQIDAVIVATPDNTHAVVAMAAIRAGKHVYVEKPLTHDVYESRALREAATKHGVATQMGNQGTASSDLRRGVDLIRAGVLGEIREVHVYNSGCGSGPRPLPEGSEPVPPELEWDLWLGPAAWRPYNVAWMRWHTWRDFGTSTLGGWATHSANLAFMALKVDSLWHDAQADGRPPRIRVRAEASGYHKHTHPRSARITYEIPARGELPPLPFVCHMGGTSYQELMQRIRKAGLDENAGAPNARRFTPHAGCLIVGTEGMLYAIAHNTRITLLPEAKFKDLKEPERHLPKSRGHEREWLDAARGGPAAMSNFDYSSPLNEFLMLGNVATLYDRQIEYDPIACQCVGDDEATAALRREYREAWTL